MRISRRFLTGALAASIMSAALCPFSLAAEGPVRVKTRVWPTKATLGAEIRLAVQIDRPQNFTIEPPSPKTDIAPFEIKRVEPLSFIQRGARVEENIILIVTVFQMDEVTIPAIPIRYADSRGISGQIFTEPVSLKVVGVPRRITDKDDIRTIKGPLSLDTWAFWALIFAILAALLTIFLVIKVILRRRKKKAIDLESLKPPHERAVLELRRLQQKKLLEAGNAKDFYSELSDILRRYLERRFQIEALEQTTFEILRTLKEKEFETAVIDKTKRVLEEADLVKFAKVVPPRSLADELGGEIEAIVQMTKLVEPLPERTK